MDPDQKPNIAGGGKLVPSHNIEMRDDEEFQTHFGSFSYDASVGHAAGGLLAKHPGFDGYYIDGLIGSFLL